MLDFSGNEVASAPAVLSPYGEVIEAIFKNEEIGKKLIPHSEFSGPGLKFEIPLRGNYK